MKPFKTYAYIYSLNRGKLNSTEMDEITKRGMGDTGSGTQFIDGQTFFFTEFFNPIVDFSRT